MEHEEKTFLVTITNCQADRIKKFTDKIASDDAENNTTTIEVLASCHSVAKNKTEKLIRILGLDSKITSKIEIK